MGRTHYLYIVVGYWYVLFFYTSLFFIINILKLLLLEFLSDCAC